jgi:malto-oligosyltrehalose synthase
MVAAMRAEGLGIIVDIVPNHMAVGNENPWWQAMLRDGPDGRYGRFFDVDWHPDNPLLQGKILLPVLGRPYGEALDEGELALAPDYDGFSVAYFGKRFPVRPEDHAAIRGQGVDNLDKAALHALLERQHYRLAHWRTAPDEINWRRFFDINELAGLRAEDEAVFEASHDLIFRLYAEGLIDGVRIDHVDGLSDPRAYCRRLRARLAELEARRPSGVPAGPAWIVVEKILGEGERLPEDWQVDGTSGYDFMDLVSAVQHAPESADALAELWASVSGRPAVFAVEEEAARREILDRGFTAQLDSAVGALHAVALEDKTTRDLSRPAIRRALVSLLAHFPVYRAYATGEVRPEGDRTAFARALAGAEAQPRLARPEVMRQLVAWLETPETPAQRVAATRFQQLSAPVAAKAVEDTAFYRYGRLLSRNDVGFAAAILGIETAEFHARNQERAADFPAAMLATATHDHKRGEDVRARLAVLSEIPEEWARTLRTWMERNARFRTIAGGAPAPAPGDQAMLYQTLLGAWPLDGELSGFGDRVGGWQDKALHEAKLHTSWTEPNAEYEKAARTFLDSVLADADFRAEIAAFARRIGPAGAVNGLAQAALKLTVPGVPDFYQGTEFWDLSLVDPDNRRPVDFTARTAALDTDGAPAALAATWPDGRVKQAVIHRLLELRLSLPDVFAQGDYIPLAAQGTHAGRLIAFSRRHGDRAVLMVVPRCVTPLLDGGVLFPPGAWSGTRIAIPDFLADRPLCHVLTGERLSLEGSAEADRLLAPFPIAVLGG